MDHHIEVPGLRITDGTALIKSDTLPESSVFEIEFWFRPDVIPATGFVPILVSELDPAYLSLWIGRANGEIAFDYGFEGRTVSAQPVPLAEKRWCHISAVYSDRGQNLALEVHVPLKPVVRRTFSCQFRDRPGHTVAVREILLGPLEESSGHMNGAFADLRLWSEARKPDDRAAQRSWRLVGNEPGLIGYWMLDEADGISFYDSSANETDGFVMRGGFDWERDSGLELIIGQLDGPGGVEYLAPKQIEHFNAKLASLDELNSALSEHIRTVLEPAVVAKQQEDATAQHDVNKQKADGDEAIANEQEKLEDRRAEIAREKEKELAKQAASRKIRLGEFIERLQDDFEVSRSKIRAEYGRVYGLDSVAVDIRMLPGFGGVGLHLPDPEKRTDPARLSTLTVEFKARQEEDTEAMEAPVPNLEDTTEIFARRKLADAGFKVDTVYQDVEQASQHGRVLAQIYDEVEKGSGKAKLGSFVVLVIGQRMAGSLPAAPATGRNV